MRSIVILVLIVLLYFPLSATSQTVNFSGKDVSLKDVFAVLKTQTGVVFFYDVTLLNETKPVTIDWKNVSLESALNETFNSQPLTWILENKTVTVIKKSPQTIPPTGIALQPQTPFMVKGAIIDADGNPISSASVMVKGTNQGTVSDNNGNFFIQARQNNVLVFSSINYSSKELKVDKGEMNIKLELEIKPMESFFIGGNHNATKRKTDATSVTVIDSKTLERIPANTIDQIFRGWVPGTNNFDVGDAPEGFPTLSIRGAASSTSLAIIAVYIDGIEYAGGSGYLSQLDKTNIDRIEIVRGPGAATMYGTGSNGGIIQIFTKKGRTGETSVNLTTSAGFYKSKWVPNDPFQQLHNVETITGFKNVSLKLGASLRSANAYLPDGGEKDKGFYAGAGFNIGKLHVNIIARNNVRNFHFSRKPYFDSATHPRNDILIQPVPGLTIPAFEWFNVKPTLSVNKDGISETGIAGINLSYRTTWNWINNLDAGYTSNKTSEVPNNDGINPFPRQYLSDKYNVMTIRYSNVLNLHKIGNNLSAAITSGAEYKKYSYAETFTRSTAPATFQLKDPDNKNFGAFIQANPSFKNVYLTLGLRYEKNELFKAALNPRLGLTSNFETGSFIFKPRISWGKGITSPTYEQRFGQLPTNVTIVYSNPDIKPQSQQGFDYGLEVYDQKGKFKFEAVYYDNVVKDMMAQESLGPDPVDTRLSSFRWTNVTKIANKGWEFSADYKMKYFEVHGTFSIMNSFMKDSSGSYILPQLKLAPGTRLVNLPKHTALLSLNYNFPKLFRTDDKGIISFNITELDGVKSVDIINYYLDIAYGRSPYSQSTTGYQVESSPVFRVGLYADYSIISDLRFFIQGSNILNSYEYEYSSTYPTHGAGWLFGLKYNFSKKN